MKAEKLEKFRALILQKLEESEKEKPVFCKTFVESFQLRNQVWLENEIENLTTMHALGVRVSAFEQLLRDVYSIALEYQRGNNKNAIEKCANAGVSLLRTMEFIEENRYV
jgi:hypothetical protein